MSEWISVESKLPPMPKPGKSVSEMVLILGSDDEPYLGWYISGKEWADKHGRIDIHGGDYVTHWMPLPNPPER